MWVRGTGFGNTPQVLATLIADKPTGPFSYVNKTGKRDPFHTVAEGIPNYPLGYQYADATVFQDPKTGKAYVYWRTRVNANHTGFRAMELTEDCTDVKPETDTQLFRTPNREAPAVFAWADQYYLWTSGTWGWSPCAMFLYTAHSPLGAFNSSIGHTWHSYFKPPTFNQSHVWGVRDGYMPAGHDWSKASKRTMTLAEAESLCGNATDCQGFTFVDFSRTPTAPVDVTFKTAVVVVPDDGDGIQPPPIPDPGQPGNQAATGEPGKWAFASQSTFILPNPQYKPGSALAPFIYMADRWEPSSASFGTYVWLPLFIDTKDPQKVKVPWIPSWRLDNATSPFHHVHG